MNQLYGAFDLSTGEWTDGCAAVLIRHCSAPDTEETGVTDEQIKWILFDGPVDAIWIESMNTVLDDNMTLCLANSERIKLKWEMRMLFEVQDLRVASPATVSRCGMVYLDDKDLGWRPAVRTWVDLLPEEPFTAAHKETIWGYLEKYVDPGVAWVRANGKEPVGTVDGQLVVALTRNFVSILNWDAATCNSVAAKGVDAEAVESGATAMLDVRTLEEKKFGEFILSAFAWAYVWSIGATVESKSRQQFATWAETLFESVSFPRTGSVFDGYIDFKSGPKWKNWDEIVPAFDYSPDMSYFELLVPNGDTVRFSYVMDRLITKKFPIFFTGSSGVGKSVIVQKLLNQMNELASVVPGYITFSAQTSAAQTQNNIEAKLDKKRKNLLGAPVKKTICLVVEDVNMPIVEEYGAQPPIELLRLLQDQSGLYDRKKLGLWKEVENTSMLLVAAPPGGGRNELTPRLSRHMSVLCMPNTSEDAMTLIFSSIFKSFVTKFKQEVQLLEQALVSATIEVYQKISEDLLPTPSRSHYLFNLRDVSKVFQGLLMVKPMQVNKAEQFTRLWLHETQRVFFDRLVDIGNREWFQAIATRLLKQKFRFDNDPEELFADKPVMFGDFMRPGVEVKVYEEITDMTKMLKIMDDNIDDYNISHSTPMNLVFFKDALEHITRIARLMRQERGNAVLVGVGGSGRQSLTRLSTNVAEMNGKEIEIIKGYGMDAFRDDEKDLLVKAGGGEGAPTVFLLNDTQIIKEAFLEDINNILNSGEVSNLFPPDEVDRLVGDLRPIAKEQGKSEAKEGVWQFFVQRVRQQLHIVLAMSPVGDATRVRFRMFPSLINCTTIDWFFPWPDDALKSVSSTKLVMEESPEEVVNALANGCVVVHKTVLAECAVFLDQLRRHVYVTPKSYLDLIQLYLEMLQEKTAEMNVAKNRLVTGLEKIADAHKVVENLQAALTELQPILVEKKAGAEKLIVVVTKESADAEVEQQKVGAEEAIVRKQADEVKATAADAQRDLDIAMPALDKALKSLDSLSKADIVEVRGFPKPPALVMMTMEAVNILLGEKPDWDTAKKVLGGSDFMDRLKSYDKDNIPASALKKIAKYVVKEEYQPDSVGRQSVAAKSLCMWTHAMDTYSKVAKEVAPKKANLARMNKEKDAAEASLAEKRAALQEVLDKVAALKKTLSDTERELANLIQEAELTKARLKRADVLTVGLADEQVRWAETVKTLDVEIHNLTGDVFLAASSVAYYGPFTGVFRLKIIDAWMEGCREFNIPMSDKFDLADKMGNVLVMKDWANQGLPTDSVSMNNGVLVTRTKRWPLMIDPQEQGTKWIKKMEGKDLRLLKLNNPKLLLVVEGCVRTGAPLLIEDIGEMLDPGLDPVLAKAVFNNNGRLQIHLGDSDVDYDPAFKLYISTKLTNPHYFPEICIKVTVVNFTVTFEGLEEQLLVATVGLELPVMMKRKEELVLQLAKDKKVLQGLEETILKLLSESGENILDDEVLISTLAESKKTSTEVGIRVKEAEVTSAEINIACVRFTPVATRGAILYFVITDLALIDPMYQNSLTFFVRLFDRSIKTAPLSDDEAQRRMFTMSQITRDVFTNICRGLFERHKLIFSFMIVANILQRAKQMKNDQLNLLLRGIGVLDMSEKPPIPEGSDIQEKQWNLVYALQLVAPRCASICEAITNNVEGWIEWMDSDNPELAPLPNDFEEENDLSIFQKMLIINALAPDKVAQCVTVVVKRTLGEAFVIFPAPTMEEVYGDATHATPVIFILSTGADPTNMLLRFAKEKGFGDKLDLISLGQGQGPKASKLIEQGCKEGNWVLLQNCHLCQSWMPKLEQLVEAFEENRAINKAFRLFLTSMPANYFPVPVLQNGIKLTNEPPKGLRANIKRSLMTTTDEELDELANLEHGSKKVEYRRICFALKFFHGTIQERRKFGPLGFNIRYEFNDSDLECATEVLKNMLMLDMPVPWETLVFVFGQINYGGRVTDDNDRTCLMAILKNFVCAESLEDGYTFSGSGTYCFPDNIEDCTVQEIRAYVDSLPLTEHPEVFGMHENANISFQQQESDVILSTVLEVQPRVSSGGGMKPEDIVIELAQSMATRVPENLSREHASPDSFPILERTGMLESTAVCLIQEMARFNFLLKALRLTLSMLEKAIKGLIVMSGDLDDMFAAILNNKVPMVWEKKAYPSLKPLRSWFDDMIARVDFFNAWVTEGKPIAYWISSFYFPQGFLTSNLQSYSRARVIPVDILSFAIVVQDFDEGGLDDLHEAPDEGFLMYGMFLDGCAWSYEDMVLTDQEPGQLYVNAPVMHLIPREHYTPNEDKYMAPFYKTSVRAGTLSTTGHSTNFVMPVELDTLHKATYWTLKGAALLSMLND
jgi:dynein heavy chain